MPGVARAVAINGTCMLVKVLSSQPAWWGERMSVVKLITGCFYTNANTRAPHFTPQHWLLCHMGLY